MTNSRRLKYNALYSTYRFDIKTQDWETLSITLQKLGEQIESGNWGNTNAEYQKLKAQLRESLVLPVEETFDPKNLRQCS